MFEGPFRNAEQIAAYQAVMDGGPITVRVASGDPDSIARGIGESLRKYAFAAKTPAPARTMPAARSQLWCAEDRLGDAVTMLAIALAATWASAVTLVAYGHARGR